jgi:hypothetical protein
MDDYDGIWNYTSLKYGTYEIFSTFWLINFYGDQNIKKNNNSKYYIFFIFGEHLKGFSPYNKYVHVCQVMSLDFEWIP